MDPNAQLITSFYTAFQQRDAAAMARCYAPEATFRDPVFRLAGWRIGAMWRMLCDRGKDLRLEFQDIVVQADRGSARWEAWYTFGGSSRPIHNIITSEFQFQRGQILAHLDRFSLHRWAGQALGLKGWLLGWAPPVQRAIRAQAVNGLGLYILQHGLDPERR